MGMSSASVLSGPIWECVEATIAWFEKVMVHRPTPPHPRERHATPPSPYLGRPLTIHC